MTLELEQLNSQADNLHLFFIIFFWIVCAVVGLFVLITLLRLLKTHNSNKRFSYQPNIQLAHVLGLKRKFVLINISLVVAIVSLIGLPVFIRVTMKQRDTAGNNFFATASAILNHTYTASVVALSNRDFGLAKQVTDTLLTNNSVQAAILIGEKGLSDSKLDYIWAISSKNANIPPVTPQTVGDLKRQTIIPDMNVTMRELNSAAIQQVSLKVAKSTTMSRIQEIDVVIDEANNRLVHFSKQYLYSQPLFDCANFGTTDTRTYFFYRPIFYVSTKAMNPAVHGAIIIQMNIDDEVAQLNKQYMQFLQLLFAIFLVLIASSIISGYCMAADVVNPLHNVIKNVVLITETADKTKLTTLLPIKKRSDEIGILADEINRMAKIMQQSALKTNDLLIGQDVQKMFVPLLLDQDNKKLNISQAKYPDVEFFGYYVGAKDVSGDYFDYFMIDPTHYIMIACDVSGKGIPAALIMIEIATMFLNYFKNQKFEDCLPIAEVATRISNFLFASALPGRFASFIICLLNTETKQVSFCNAGNNIVHYYKNSTKRIETIQLQKSLAAGVMADYDIPQVAQYVEETFQFESGDILFLGTDGLPDSRRPVFIEDTAKRMRKRRKAKQITYKPGTDFETFGTERVHDIFNAVINKQRYTLTLTMPDGIKNYDFDFSTSRSDISDIVLAIIAIENFFRITAIGIEGNSDEKVFIDSILNDVLKKYLTGYNELDLKLVLSSEQQNVVQYKNVRQEEQFDDTALLLVHIQ